MRHLTPSAARARGMTLLELMVALGIMSMLALTAAPYFSGYGVNSRLREGGNTLYGEALFAQSEAIKRNRVVRVATNGATITVSDMTVPDTPAVLRTRQLPEGVSAATAAVDFGTQGWPSDFTAASINVSSANVTCSADHRCPGLRIEAGGAIRLCGNHLDGCS